MTLVKLGLQSIHDFLPLCDNFKPVYKFFEFFRRIKVVGSVGCRRKSLISIQIIVKDHQS
jgi:hypothetical protein